MKRSASAKSSRNGNGHAPQLNGNLSPSDGTLDNFGLRTMSEKRPRLCNLSY
jgi:hypothetical protein